MAVFERSGSRGCRVAALACAAALWGCGGPGAHDGAAPRGAPGGAAPAGALAAAPSACSPAILDAVPAAQPRAPLRAQLLECSLAEARTMGSVGPRAMIIDRIAAGFSAAEGYRRAVEVACAFAPDAGRRAMILHDVASALARGGHVDHAIRLVEAIAPSPRDAPSAPGALSPQPQILPPDPLDASGAWMAIGIAQAKAGDIPRALESARRLPGPGACAVQLAAVAALRAQGRGAEAQPLLDECAEAAARSPMEHEAALAGAAELYALGGQKDRAAALLRGAIQQLEGRGKWGQGSRAHLAASLGKIGLHREAIPLLARHAQVQSGLAAHLAEAGQLDAAREVAEAIGEGAWRARAMAALAQKLGEAGDARRAEAAWKDARDAAVSVAFPRFKVEALADLGARLARARRVAEAERTLAEAADLAASIQDASEKKLALREAAVAHAAMGRCVRGLEIARTLGDSGYTIREIAASCADPGDHGEVHARIPDITHADHRGEALGALAVRYAEAGQLDRALAAVSEIQGPEERARALASLGAAALPGAASPWPGCPPRP